MPRYIRPDPEDCKHESKSDFSFFPSWLAEKKEPHFFCGDCKSRWYKGIQWTEKEWFNFVNSQ